MAAQAMVAEQIHLIRSDLDRRGWSPDTHAEFPPRFRAVARTLLLCARTAGCLLTKLPNEVLAQLIGVLAQRTYWPPPTETSASGSAHSAPASLPKADAARPSDWMQMHDPRSGDLYMTHPNMPYNMHSPGD